MEINNQQDFIVNHPTKKELKYLKSTAIPWVIIGLLLVVVAGTLEIMLIKAYIFEGYRLIRNKKDTTISSMIFLGIIIVIGACFMYRGIKLIIDMKNMLVTQVIVSGLSDKGWDDFIHKGRFEFLVEGKITTLEAPIAFGAEKSIRKNGRAKLYFVPNKTYMLGKRDI